MTNPTAVLLGLLRQDDAIRLEQVSSGEWRKVIDLAFEQGVDAVSVDGYNKWLSAHPGASPVLETDESLEDDKFEWFCSVLQAEADYRKYERVLAHIADIYSKSGMTPLMVKGYVLAQDYPVPQHRLTGDIDIFMGTEGDEAVRRAGINVKAEYHKHSLFMLKGIPVENHRKFLDDVKHRSNARFERILRQVLHDDRYPSVELTVHGRRILVPDDTFNALFLLRHTGEHFAADKITLRHVLDMGYFFCAHYRGIDWASVLKVYREEHMKKFYDAIGTICIEYLGMKPECFPGLTIDRPLAAMVLDDTFSRSGQEDEPSRRNILRYGLFMTRRWWCNRWKYRLVYDETLIGSFFTLALNRLKGDKADDSFK